MGNNDLKKISNINIYIFMFGVLFILAMLGTIITNNQTNINTLILNANTNALNDELNIKYLIENDQILAEELLDQKQRIETIEEYLGISEGGPYVD